MKNTSKVLVTIVVVIVFIMLSAIITGVRSEAGHSTPGILPMILLIGLIGALRAIWKKKKDDSDSNNNEILQK